MELHGGMQCEIPCITAADVKVLVEPPIGRHKETAFVPWDNDFLFALFPHNGVAFPGGNDDGAARGVAVGLFMSSSRKPRHVGRSLRVGKLNIHASAASAPSGIRLQFVPGPHVREEIAVPIDT